MPNLYSGTSGFAYPSWKPEFYPEKLAAKKFLSYYATRLNAVEVNYTFRRLPSASTLENWVNDTRAGFVFPLKAHMRITHILRLKPSEFTEVFFRAIDPLRTARRLGPVLFQLPPALKCDEALLGDFLATLPPDIRCAFEFRHASWLTDATYGLLEKHGVALCLAESERIVIPKVITSEFVYFRLRMPEYSARGSQGNRRARSRIARLGPRCLRVFQTRRDAGGRVVRRRAAKGVSGAGGAWKLNIYSVFVPEFLPQQAQLFARFALLVGKHASFFKLVIGDSVDHGGDIGVDALLSFG